MAVSASLAASKFRSIAEIATAGWPIDTAWADKVERLSHLCNEGGALTHIAFLGTSMLAKATDSNVDLVAIKPNHAPGNPRAYSARSLCHGVLVPLSAEYGVHIGVTGREPLNNQPYFRMTALDDGTPVHGNSRPAFDYMRALVGELQTGDAENAERALRAFIAVRQRYFPRYTTASGELTVDSDSLAARIDTLVRENSEGGARAQAAAAGLLDVFAGDGRVESGRINDPSRHYPGDVAVKIEADDGTEQWEKAIEVRDKPVLASDVHVFCGKCLETGVREAAILMVAPSQIPLDDAALKAAAGRNGLGLTLFYGWKQFVEQVLFWSSAPKPLATIEAVQRIEARLIGVEASPQAVERWQALVRG